jgi:hypothetical protein
MWFKLAVMAVMAGQLSLTACAGKQKATEPTKGASQAGQAEQVAPQEPAYQRWTRIRDSHLFPSDVKARRGISDCRL